MESLFDEISEVRLLFTNPYIVYTHGPCYVQSDSFEVWELHIDIPKSVYMNMTKVQYSINTHGVTRLTTDIQNRVILDQTYPVYHVNNPHNFMTLKHFNELTLVATYLRPYLHSCKMRHP